MTTNSTASGEALAVRPMSRTVAVEDLHVVEDGDGRTVEAYAAVFGVRAEIVDQDGHYQEENDPKSFNQTVGTRGTRFGVLFNHGRTIDGTPAGELTMPIGVPMLVQPDAKGVFTRTRYLDNPLADGVLKAIKAGAITAQSFSGRFIKSYRTYPGGRGRTALPLITRKEVDMREYGPAVFAAYPEAAILGTRAEGLAALVEGQIPSGSDPLSLFVRALLSMSPTHRLHFLEQFEITTPEFAPPGPEDSHDIQTEADTQSEAGRTVDQTGEPQNPQGSHSDRSDTIPDWRARIREKRDALGI